MTQESDTIPKQITFKKLNFQNLQQNLRNKQTETGKEKDLSQQRETTSEIENL